MSETKKRCVYCHRDYRPDPRTATFQKSCSAPACHRKRKQGAQSRYLQKNPDYFRGRYGQVKVWLAAPPGYLKAYRASHPEQLAKKRLQNRRRRRRMRGLARIYKSRCSDGKSGPCGASMARIYKTRSGAASTDSWPFCAGDPARIYKFRVPFRPRPRKISPWIPNSGPTSAVARELNVHRDTVRWALAAHDGPPKNGFSRPAVPSKLDAFKPHLAKRIAQFPDVPGTTLFREIRGQGYVGSILWEHLQTIRPTAPKSFLRLETPPGEFAQVDWAHCGTTDSSGGRPERCPSRSPFSP